MRKTGRPNTFRSGSASNPTAVSDSDAVHDVTVVENVADTAKGASGSSRVCDTIINELLCYVCFYRDRSNVDALRRIMLSSFLPLNITEAKKIIVDKFRSHLVSCPLLADRRGSSSRAAHEAEIDDILGLLDLLDNQQALDDVKFVAANLEMLPHFGPEEINPAAVVERQIRVEATVDNLSSAVQQLSASHAAAADNSLSAVNVHSMINEMRQKIESFTQAVESRLDHLNIVCSTSLVSSQTADRGQLNSVLNERNDNVIIFGIPEDRDATQWRNRVDEVLRYVAGHAVDVIDMYRLGRYSDGRIRPILIKLRTVWDKRIILSKCSKLKNYTVRGIFVAADEPLETRRKQTFDRLKYRAERAGKSVSVVDGVLFIDDCAKFSLIDGFIRPSVVDHGRNSQA